MADKRTEHGSFDLHDLQERICNTPYPIASSARALFKQLKTVLLAAYREERLSTPPHDILRFLQKKSSARGGAHEIYGGEKDNRRRSDVGWFRRDDGALFNFKLTVIEHRQALILESYAFELRLPHGKPGNLPQPEFLRFDLNHSRHHNSERGLRCHLHPGNDDVQVPSPLIAPVELLQLFLYHVRLPVRARQS